MHILTSLILLLSTASLLAQPDKTPVIYLANNAIEIENLNELDDALYSEINKYEVILVGEMHGTNEPAEFSYGLCKIIAKHEGEVTLALEAPSKLIGELSPSPTLKELSQTEFFQMENFDGRNGQAWLDLILRCHKNPQVTVNFIDNNTCSPRDSSMYLDIVKIKKGNPNTKIITLTGNIHNWLKPFRGNKKLGAYLKDDTLNFNAEKIMSINHLYKEGTMMNNTGNGLELKTVEGKDNFLNQTVKSSMYLSPQVFKKQNQYTHFLFTEKVTHSDRVRK